MEWWSFVLLIVFACLVGLFWFFWNFFSGLNELQGKQEEEFLTASYQKLLSQSGANPGQSVDLTAVSLHIDYAMGQIQFPQLILILCLILIFLLVVVVGFVDNAIGYFMGLVFGSLSIGLFTYFSLQIIPKTLTRSIFYSDNQADLLGYIYNSGFSITSLMLSTVFGLFLIYYGLAKAFFIEELNAEGAETLSRLVFGYVMGMILGGFVYREAPSLLSRSLKTATFGLIRTESNLSFENNQISIVTKLAYMISNQLGQIIINYIDSAIILIFLCGTGILVLSNSPEILESEINEAVLLGPAILAISNYFSLIFAFFFRTAFYDEDVTGFTALNIRWQVILCSIIAFFLYLFLGFSVSVQEFTLVGEESEQINTEAQQGSAVSWCCILGLILNIFMISIFECFTSHGCSPVRNLVIKYQSIHINIRVNHQSQGFQA